MNDVDKILQHYGILGMHWGKRQRAYSERDSAHKIAKKYTDAMDKKVEKRTGDRKERAIRETKIANKIAKKYTDAMDKKAEKRDAEYKKAAGHPDNQRKLEIQRKRLKDMSNADLRDLTTRMQLEKQYRDLKRDDITAGQRLVKDLFVKAAKQTATVYITKGMTKGVATIIKKALL